MMRHFVPLAVLGTALLPGGAAAVGWQPYYPCAPFPVPCYPQPVVILPACCPPVECYPAPVLGRVPAAPPTVTQDPPAKPEAAKPDVPAAPVPKAPTGPIAPMPGVPRTSIDPPESSPAEAVRIPATVPVIPVTPSTPLAPPRPVEPAGAAIPEPIKVPAPVVEPGRLPPLVPRIPGGDSSLPPLQIVPPAETSTSRSSPLSDRKSFEVVPVSGAAPASPTALRTVGVFNHSDRDVTLTVEGETVTLPKRTYLTAAVPRTFTWKLDGGDAQSTEVPAASPGVEIVIRR